MRLVTVTVHSFYQHVSAGFVYTQWHVCRLFPARSSGACASEGYSQNVFLKGIDGTCYKTNDCLVAASYDQSCINSQNIPVRQVPFSGPGVLINNVYAGNAADWWRYS